MFGASEVLSNDLADAFESLLRGLLKKLNLAHRLRSVNLRLPSSMVLGLVSQSVWQSLY